MSEVPCKCGRTMVPDTGWDGYISGRIKCSVLCDNELPIYEPLCEVNA